MEFQEVEKLLKLFQETDLDKLEWRQGEASIILERKALSSKAAPPTEPEQPSLLTYTASSLPEKTESSTETAVVESDLQYVTAPLVGTFYRSPSPDAPAFVKMGDKVKKGDTLCIIEAMKLLNEIDSDVDGTIVGILIENANPVEFGTNIFAIRPN